MNMERVFAVAGSVSAAVSVLGGAFGAHILKVRLSSDLLGVFETGVRYQVYHSLGLLAVAFACKNWPGANIQMAGWAFIAGILIFCGSLYALALTGVRYWGAVTPVGGVAFTAGWLILAIGVWRAE